VELESGMIVRLKSGRWGYVEVVLPDGGIDIRCLALAKIDPADVDYIEEAVLRRRCPHSGSIIEER
jgi:hypothetical protein